MQTQELTYCAHLIDVYLNNTREIYDNYTLPLINTIAKETRNINRMNWEKFVKVLSNCDKFDSKKSYSGRIYAAVMMAARMVNQLDGIKAVADDIKQATEQYVYYIIESVKYELRK